MAKILLLSVVIATVTIPLITARDARAPRGLKKTVTWFAVFMTLYVLACLVIYPRL